MKTGEEQAESFCEGCHKRVKEVFEFYCRVCHSTIPYCKTCLSVAAKKSKCIDCYQEEG